MLASIPEQRRAWIAETVAGMTLEQKVAQVIGLHFAERNEEQVRELIETYQPGSILGGGGGKDQDGSQRIREMFADYNARHEIPLLLSGDCESGAGIAGASTPFPWSMAVGACDDEQLAYEMGLATGIEARAFGIHWTYSPIVDLDLNRNPMCMCRCFGEDPAHVARMARAFIRGCQTDGNLACAAKHFPGDGVDLRDAHVIASINSLPMDQWWETFGYVYREVIDEGVMSIMTGQLALPAVDAGDGGYLGPPPATMSRKIQTDLLRGELGFEGLIVTDAIDMIGYASRLPKPRRAITALAAGADIVLRCEVRDFEWIAEAVRNGEIPQEQLDASVRRVLELKARVGLFDDKPAPDPTEHKERFETASRTICENAVTVLRDATGLLPLTLDAGAKVLTMDLQFAGRQRGRVQGLQTVAEALQEHGLDVDHWVSPLHGEFDIYPVIDQYDAIFVNFHVPARYGSTRMHSEIIDALWNGWWMDHGRVVFTSFGNPYTIWELPWMPNYINTFSNSAASQRAAVKVWLGEMPARGKSPVRLEGFFDIQVGGDG
ncbi:MAG: glycoside hydrolase family 3 protein [Phycisphaerae bacterium]|nr:glycoside hydrolase family 3 protein [Phycisphaerae bacterium]